MEYNIREYVDRLFENAPQTQKAYELKVELAQNLTDKYYALLAEGKSEEDAYNLTIMSIGNIEELFAGLEDTDTAGAPYTYPSNVPPARRSAAIVAVSVMLIILSVVPVLVLEHFGAIGETLGVVIMFLMVALGVGLLIYNHMTKPRKKPVTNNVVEDFKEWSEKGSNRKHAMKTISSIYWPMVVAIYFIISFSTRAWYITWLVFLIASSLFAIIKAILSISDK